MSVRHSQSVAAAQHFVPMNRGDLSEIEGREKGNDLMSQETFDTYEPRSEKLELSDYELCQRVVHRPDVELLDQHNPFLNLHYVLSISGGSADEVEPIEGLYVMAVGNAEAKELVEAYLRRIKQRNYVRVLEGKDRMYQKPFGDRPYQYQSFEQFFMGVNWLSSTLPSEEAERVLGAYFTAKGDPSLAPDWLLKSSSEHFRKYFPKLDGDEDPLAIGGPLVWDDDLRMGVRSPTLQR